MVNKDLREAVECRNVDPEIIALNRQTIEEVKEILKKYNDPVLKQTPKKEEPKKVKLTFETACELGSGEMFDVYKVKGQVPLKKERDVFAFWRKMADVKVGNPELEAESLTKTEELMQFLLIKLGASFPKLNLDWSSGWNPKLTVNDCPTQITMEKLGLAYQGILNIADEANAKEIVSNIIHKKFKELFV